MIDVSSVLARSAVDLIAERIPLPIGDREYVLPILKAGPNGRWLEALDAQFRGLLTNLQLAPTEPGPIYTLMATEMDKIKDALYAYDTTGVLPPRDVLDEQLTNTGWILTLARVWAAAHPFRAVTLLAALLNLQQSATNGSSTPTSSSPPSTGGRRRRSRPS